MIEAGFASTTLIRTPLHARVGFARVARTLFHNPGYPASAGYDIVVGAFCGGPMTQVVTPAKAGVQRYSFFRGRGVSP